MFTFKKIVLVLVVIALAFSIVGCGDKNNDNTAPTGLVDQLVAIDSAIDSIQKENHGIINFLTCQSGSKVCSNP